MTSRQARIEDPEVKALSLKIIKSQEEEITMMKAYTGKLQGK